jgi:O-antigen/teichoic acid export membrane protein
MENFKIKVIIDSLIYTLLPKLSFIVSIISLPWISPFLTLKDYGIFGILISYISIFQTIISFGQNIIIQNSYFTHNNKYKLVWNRSFAIMIIIALIMSILFYLSCLIFLNKLLNDKFALVFILSTIYFILIPFEVISQHYFILKQKSIQYSIGLSISGIIGSIISIIAIRYYNYGYVGWILSLSSISFLNFIIFSYLIFYKEKITPNFKIKKLFLLKSTKDGLLLLPHQISLYILNASDRILLNYFNIPISRIGYYSQGYNFGAQGNLLVNGVFQSLSKNLQENFRSNEFRNIQFVKKAIIVVPVSISIVLFIISIWLKEVFIFLFKNPELNKAYPVAIVVLAAFMYWSIYTFFTIPLSIKNKPLSISIISLVAALTNIIGNFLFIPKYGINASIIFTYVSYVLFGFIGIFNSENRIYFNKYINIIKFCFIMFVLNISLLLISYYLIDLVIHFKLLITLITILMLCLFLKYINKLI